MTESAVKLFATGVSPPDFTSALSKWPDGADIRYMPDIFDELQAELSGNGRAA
jgi:hypothetical protein